MPQEHAEYAVAEIEKRASDPAFMQVMISPRSSDPLGHRRYWPIYAAAERCNKPMALHVAGYSGGHSSTGTGWPTYYLQEHYAMATGMESTLASLVFEGVFERFPKLKVVLIEGGFAWAPALGWRMDKHWARMRAEVPHLKRPPSEYVRAVWLTPADEEPDDRAPGRHHAVVGWDPAMFPPTTRTGISTIPGRPSGRLTEAEGHALQGQRAALYGLA